MPVGTEPELRLEPSLEQARELSGEGNVVPVRLTVVDDCETPVSAFLKLRDAAAGPCFLLESAEQGQVGRYSFLGVRPRAMLRWSDGTLSEWSAAAQRRRPGDDLPGGAPTHTAPSRITCRVSARPRSRGCRRSPAAPSASSATTSFGRSSRSESPTPTRSGFPDMALMITDVMLAFDHLRHELTILACAFADDEGGIDAAYSRAAEAIADVRRVLRGPVPAPAQAAVAEPPRFTSNMEREEFEAAVARIIRYVHAGDAFQVVPSQRFSAELPGDPFSIYRGLRAVNPSPYMYFLEFGDFQLAGASPEPLVKVSGRRVETRPIAGTYPRGDSEEADRRLAERLVNDPKERAEHVMLVDLSRNDLGRVCEFGSIGVDELMVVETYSHVLHIVSQVSGRLREGIGRDGRPALGPARRNPLGCPQGEGDADHRRAGDPQALLLRGRDRLPLLGR